MYVVVVGSRKWTNADAEKQVNQLLDELKNKYSGLIVVSSSCDQGVGSVVKTRCLRDKTTFQLIEYQVRLFVDLPRTKQAQVHAARNRSLQAIGEEFHVFVDPDRRGTFEDLIESVVREGRGDRVHTHLPQKLEEGAEGK